MEVFNEQKLRAEIVKTWGEFGAHIEVYDMLLKKANVVLQQAPVNGSLPLAVEFGYKQCEKGNNLEMALIEFEKINGNFS